jgi:hypothetical protein
MLAFLASRLEAIAGTTKECRRHYLNNFIAWEAQHGNVGSVTSHEVTVENAQDGLVGNDKEVVRFALKFEDDGFESDGYVVIGLNRVSTTLVM